MVRQNAFISAARFAGREIIGGILYYPIWWYTVGLVAFLKRRLDSIYNFEGSIGLTVWLLNWSTPMFGQYDIWGRAISFGVRTAMIIFKAIQITLYSLFQLIWLAVWLLWPPAVLWQLWYHVTAWL